MVAVRALVLPLLLLLVACRRVMTTGTQRMSIQGPRLQETLDVFDINRLIVGWRRNVTSGCGDDVTSLLSAMDNGTLWADKSEYSRASVQRSRPDVSALQRCKSKVKLSL
jgi:hypothetical protein